MSNLGWYQIFTTNAKKVGGAKNLMGMLIGSGAVLGVSGTILTQKVIKLVKRKNTREPFVYLDNRVLVVSMEYKDKYGLILKPGDKFRVLEKDNDSVLIEKVGDENNPYWTSSLTLKKISDY